MAFLERTKIKQALLPFQAYPHLGMLCFLPSGRFQRESRQANQSWNTLAECLSSNSASVSQEAKESDRFFTRQSMRRVGTVTSPSMQGGPKGVSALQPASPLHGRHNFGRGAVKISQCIIGLQTRTFFKLCLLQIPQELMETTCRLIACRNSAWRLNFPTPDTVLYDSWRIRPGCDRASARSNI